MKKIVSSSMLALILISTLTVAFNIKPAKAEWTGMVYIRADGSVDPPTAPIQRDGDIYTFTDNIYDSMVVQRDNIVVDGNGYMLQGPGTWEHGLLLGGKNVTIKNLIIKEFIYALTMSYSQNNKIVGNKFSRNHVGIHITFWNKDNVISDNALLNNDYGIVIQFWSNHTTIFRNNVSENWVAINFYYTEKNMIFDNTLHNNNYGLSFVFSSYNIVTRNNITNCGYGINFHDSSANIIHHNNFINNLYQVFDMSWKYMGIKPSMNIWDDGYPSGGNYWSDYTGVDKKSGPNQNLPGSDGIGDTPYIIDEYNIDRYPLMRPWTPTPSLKPVASFNYNPVNPKVNEKVIFDASASYDPDGQIVSFRWNFGDGSTGEGRIVTHSYLKEGNYKVTLTVVDNNGLSSSTSKTVTVVKPKMDERIENAIAWALDWADGPPYPAGSYKPEYRDVLYKGYCLAFVQDAYQYGAKASITRYSSAKEAWQSLSPLQKGIPPRGAYVFYDVTSGAYAEYDHVGLSLGNGKVVHAHHLYGPVIDNNYEKLTRGYGSLKYIGWAWPPLKPPIKTSGLTVLATCPVDLVITDPDYLVISKEYNEIPGAVYIEEDLNEDCSLDDYIFIPIRKTGEYLINVIPEPDADPTATYTLEVSSEGISFLLAENIPISDISTEPYILHATIFEVPPTPSVTAGIDLKPNTLNLGSMGYWITAYIELPEGFDVADIDITTILLNNTLSVDVNAPITIGDYDNDSIPDLMVKFIRADVISYILANVDLAELYENRFMTVTLTITGKLNDGTPFQGSCEIRIVLSMLRLKISLVYLKSPYF